MLDRDYSTKQPIAIALSTLILLSIFATTGVSASLLGSDRSSVHSLSSNDDVTAENISINHAPFSTSSTETDAGGRIYTALPAIESDRNLSLDNGTNYQFRLTNDDTGRSVTLAFNGSAEAAFTTRRNPRVTFGVYNSDGTTRSTPVLRAWSTNYSVAKARVVDGAVPEVTGLTNFSVALLNASTGEELARTNSRSLLTGYNGIFDQNSTTGDVKFSLARDNAPRNSNVSLRLVPEDTGFSDYVRVPLSYDPAIDAFTTVVDADAFDAGNYSWRASLNWRGGEIIDVSNRRNVTLGNLSEGDDSDSAPVADLTASSSEIWANPGDKHELTYTLTNDGDQYGSWTSIWITHSPANWTITSGSSDWHNNVWRNRYSLGVGEQYTGTATVTIPENASIGEYTVNATSGLNSDAIDNTTVNVTLTEGFATGQYDTDGDGSVAGDLNGALRAIADYSNGQLNQRQILRVIASYNS